MSVKSDNAEPGTPLDFFSITNYKLLELKEESLLIQINFQMPEKISVNLVNPDQLIIKVKLGFIFID